MIRQSESHCSLVSVSISARTLSSCGFQFIAQVLLFIAKVCCPSAALVTTRTRSLPAKRLRATLCDSILSDRVSAERAATLLSDAQSSSAANIGNLFKLRKMSKKTVWLRPYVASIRVWNAKLAKEEVAQVPLILPRDLVHALARRGGRRIFSKEDMDPVTAERLSASHQELGLNIYATVWLGLAGRRRDLYMGSVGILGDDHQVVTRAQWFLEEHAHLHMGA